MATIEEFMRQWADESPYIEAQTSGSTGTPKKIRLLKSDMAVSAKATNVFFGINAASVLGLPLSIDYIAGKMMAVRSFISGCRLLELPVSNEIHINETFDLLSIVPTQIPSLLSNVDIADKIRNLLIGGAPLSMAQEALICSSGIKSWLSYGMTETCSHVALRRVGGNGVFHAMPGISFSKDSRDCLIIESHDFSWGRLETNDIIKLVSPTDFLWIGRYDNVVNSGGLKLHPEELETEYLKKGISLPPFYLVGEPDDYLGQRLVMVMESAPENILDTLRKFYPDHRTLPKRIISVKSLPRTKNGKLLRLKPNQLL